MIERPGVTRRRARGVGKRAAQPVHAGRNPQPRDQCPRPPQSRRRRGGRPAPIGCAARPQSASPRSRPQSARPHRPPVIVDGEHVWVKTSSPLHDATAPLLRIEGAALAAAPPREQTLEGRLSASQQRADALDARCVPSRRATACCCAAPCRRRRARRRRRSGRRRRRRGSTNFDRRRRRAPSSGRESDIKGRDVWSRARALRRLPRRGGLASKSSHQYARAKAAALAGGYRPPSPPQPRLPPRRPRSRRRRCRTTAADDAADAADAVPAVDAASAQQMLEAVLRHLERHGHTEAAAGVRSAFSPSARRAEGGCEAGGEAAIAAVGTPVVAVESS